MSLRSVPFQNQGEKRKEERQTGTSLSFDKDKGKDTHSDKMEQRQQKSTDVEKVEKSEMCLYVILNLIFKSGGKKKKRREPRKNQCQKKLQGLEAMFRSDEG